MTSALGVERDRRRERQFRLAGEAGARSGLSRRPLHHREAGAAQTRDARQRDRRTGRSDFKMKRIHILCRLSSDADPPLLM